jgi:hypothetical protein
VILNCLDANGDLKETEGISDADRCPANIQFACLDNDIRFGSINKGSRQPYPFTYYVRLLMELDVVQDNQGNDVHLLALETILPRPI